MLNWGIQSGCFKNPVYLIVVAQYWIRKSWTGNWLIKGRSEYREGSTTDGSTCI